MTSEPVAALPAERGGVARAAVARIAARGVSSAALGATLLLTARGTPIADFGDFMVVYAIGLVVGLVAGVGAPTRVLRSSAEKPELSGALFMVHTVVVTTAFAAVVAVYVGIGWTPMVAAGLVFAYGDTVQNYAQAYLTSADRQVEANVLVVSHRTIPLVAAAATLGLTGHGSYLWLTVAFAAPAAIGLAAPVGDLSRRSFRATRSVVSGGFGYWWYSASAIIAQIQIPIVGLVAAPAIVGSFSMATRVVGPITLFTASMSAVLVPELSRRLDDRRSFDSLYRTSMRISVLYLLLVVLVSWPGAILVVALAGPQYADSTVLVFAMIVAAGIGAYSQGFNSRLLALGAAGRSAFAVIAGGLAGVVVILVVGASGAASDLLWTSPLVAQMVIAVLLARSVRVGFAADRPSGRHSLQGRPV